MMANASHPTLSAAFCAAASLKHVVRVGLDDAVHPSAGILCRCIVEAGSSRGSLACPRVLSAAPRASASLKPVILSVHPSDHAGLSAAPCAAASLRLHCVQNHLACSISQRHCVAASLDQASPHCEVLAIESIEQQPLKRHANVPQQLPHQVFAIDIALKLLSGSATLGREIERRLRR